MSVIYSYINYCNVVWDAAYCNPSKALVILEKTAVGILDKSNYDAASSVIFCSVRLVNIRNIQCVNCLRLLFFCLTSNKFPVSRKRIFENTLGQEYNT